MHFLPILLKKLVFCFSLFCVFYLYCLEFEAIFMKVIFIRNNLNVFVIIIFLGTKCSVILFIWKIWASSWNFGFSIALLLRRWKNTIEFKQVVWWVFRNLTCDILKDIFLEKIMKYLQQKFLVFSNKGGVKKTLWPIKLVAIIPKK